MKSRYGAFALMGSMALVVAGCGSAPEEEAAGGASDAGGADYLGCMVSDAGGFNDQSFNESGFEGLQAAEERLGIETRTAESQDESAYTPNLDSLVSAGCNQIVTVGFLLADATGTAAEANPDTSFALVDAETETAMDNVKPLLFDTAQAAYLAGYAAAAVSETGTVATWGGVKIPPVTIFMDGFVEGVAKYNEDNGEDVQVLGWDVATQDGQFTGDFEDVAKGQNTTNNLISAGADVTLPVAGPVGTGALSAAQAANADGGQVKVIWVDSDGYEAQPDYQDLILTSVVKEIGTAVETSMQAGVDGEFSADPYVGTLENEGVGLAPFHDFDGQLPEGLKEELMSLQEQVIAGDIVVESPASPQQ